MGLNRHSTLAGVTGGRASADTENCKVVDNPFIPSTGLTETASTTGTPVWGGIVDGGEERGVGGERRGGERRELGGSKKQKRKQKELYMHPYKLIRANILRRIVRRAETVVTLN